MGLSPASTHPSETSLDETSVLVIPGWNGSGLGHWQTLWEEKYEHFRRVKQQNWSRPSRAEWTARIDADLNQALRPYSWSPTAWAAWR